MATSHLTSVVVVRLDEALDATERGAVAGGVAPYSGTTLISYATDLGCSSSGASRTASVCRRFAGRSFVARPTFGGEREASNSHATCHPPPQWRCPQPTQALFRYRKFDAVMS
jgi:hypothetical protein